MSTEAFGIFFLAVGGFFVVGLLSWGFNWYIWALAVVCFTVAGINLGDAFKAKTKRRGNERKSN